ncbi:MAG: hypothetical protein GVY05_08740 [Bacteroidetes bacterium]|jgi:preprotein translocase subunit SecG|nr:hypothetical protein [Bacteroidota bacterium]
MEPNKNKNLERLVNKAMQASKIEQTPSDFTANVMSQIEVLEFQKNKKTPIISKSTWVFIIAFLVGFIIISNFLESDNQLSYFQNFIEFIRIDSSYFNFVPSIKISDIFMYSILLFGVMFSIQIPLIKYYYSKRIKN